ncbi:MAG: hypothetical protein WED04_00095 [Promethearchaeati archaeon SRVP18_Atabeyarchaeia-1]
MVVTTRVLTRGLEESRGATGYKDGGVYQALQPEYFLQAGDTPVPALPEGRDFLEGGLT